MFLWRFLQISKWLITYPKNNRGHFFFWNWLITYPKHHAHAQLVISTLTVFTLTRAVDACIFQLHHQFDRTPNSKYSSSYSHFGDLVITYRKRCIVMPKLYHFMVYDYQITKMAVTWRIFRVRRTVELVTKLTCAGIYCASEGENCWVGRPEINFIRFGFVHYLAPYQCE